MKNRVIYSECATLYKYVLKKMALLHLCGNGHWMGSLDSECVYLQRTLDCTEIPLIRKTGWGTTERKERDGQKEGETGREDALLYEKGG